MINAQDIKIGTCIRMDGKLYFCIDFLHVKPGKGNTFMRTKLKDVVNGYVLERRFNIGEKLEDVRVERRPHQYLYHDGDNYQFMNQETFDQIPIAHDLINGVDFLLFQPFLIFTLAFLTVEKLNHGGIKATRKCLDCFIRVAGFVRLLLFVQMVSSENQSSISCPRLRFFCGTFMVRSCLRARIFSRKLRTSSGARWSASR